MEWGKDNQSKLLSCHDMIYDILFNKVLYILKVQASELLDPILVQIVVDYVKGNGARVLFSRLPLDYKPSDIFTTLDYLLVEKPTLVETLEQYENIYGTNQFIKFYSFSL